MAELAWDAGLNFIETLFTIGLAENHSTNKNWSNITHQDMRTIVAHEHSNITQTTWRTSLQTKLKKVQVCKIYKGMRLIVSLHLIGTFK